MMFEKLGFSPYNPIYNIYVCVFIMISITILSIVILPLVMLDIVVKYTNVAQFFKKRVKFTIKK